MLVASIKLIRTTGENTSGSATLLLEHRTVFFSFKASPEYSWRSGETGPGLQEEGVSVEALPPFNNRSDITLAPVGGVKGQSLPERR